MQFSNPLKKKVITILIIISLILCGLLFSFGLGCCVGCSTHKPIYAFLLNRQAILITLKQEDFLNAIKNGEFFTTSWAGIRDVSFVRSPFDSIGGNIYSYPPGFCSSSALAILREAPLTQYDVSTLINKRIVLENGYITNWKLAKKFLNPYWNVGYIVRVQSFSSDTHFCVLKDKIWYNNGASIQWEDVEKLSFLNSDCYYEKEIVVNRGIS